jgi:hypothetical protein
VVAALTSLVSDSLQTSCRLTNIEGKEGKGGGGWGTALTSFGDERLGSHEHTQRAPVIGLHYKLLLVDIIAPDSATGL